MAKPDRPPIFERLKPFAPWDQRGAPSLLDEAQTQQRAASLAAASDRLAAGLRTLADAGHQNDDNQDGNQDDAVSRNLQHLASVAEWSAGVWRQAFDDTAAPATDELSGLCDAAAQRTEPIEALAALARVAVPRLIAAAVLLQAELGDELSLGRERWMRLVIEELETTRADLELVIQSQLAPGDGPRLASACAEVAKTVC